MKQKEDYEKLEYELIKCDQCNMLYKKIAFSYKDVRKDGTAKYCKVCSWINRHYGVPKIDGFTNDEILSTLKFLLFEERIYVNDLSLAINRNINDTIKLIQKLKIGNKTIRVKNICTCCGADIVQHMKVYQNTKNPYCSYDCYWKDKTNRVPHGEDSPYYNRITTNCTNCGQEIKVIPYAHNTKNKYGETHNFCSQECYWEYRSKYYVGEKTYMFGKEMTNEVKEKL